jgi:ATP-binding protein involved in chromosome partitioning
VPRWKPPPDTDPHTGQNLLDAGCVRDLDIQGGRVSLGLELGYAGCSRTVWRRPCKWPWKPRTAWRRRSVRVDVKIAAHKAQAQVPGMAT